MRRRKKKNKKKEGKRRRREKKKKVPCNMSLPARPIFRNHIPRQ
jgi:hypothetical protein